MLQPELTIISDAIEKVKREFAMVGVRLTGLEVQDDYDKRVIAEKVIGVKACSARADPADPVYKEPWAGRLSVNGVDIRSKNDQRRLEAALTSGSSAADQGSKRT